jgi:transposase
MFASFVIFAIAILGSPQSTFAEAADDSAQKTILVTGASSGIGLKIAETLAANGYFVYAGARIIPAKAVAPFRQGHKTDSNDALAVAEAARRPNIKEAPMKTVEQQGLQAIQRSRDLLIQESTALSNHLRGLLMEFGVVIPKGFASLRRELPEILEDGDNEVPDMYRPNTASSVRSLAGAARGYRGHG